MRGADHLRSLIGAIRRVVVFTGAGISTESGIPDFRSPGGVWSRHKPVYFDDFMASEARRREYWRLKFMLDRDIREAKPNAGHLAVARLVRSGKAGRVITQNVDGLEIHQPIPNSLISLPYLYDWSLSFYPARGQPGLRRTLNSSAALTVSKSSCQKELLSGHGSPLLRIQLAI